MERVFTFMSHQPAGAPQSARKLESRGACCVVIPGVLLLVLAAGGVGATELKLGSVSLPGKGEVRFETRFSQPVDQPECDIKGKNVDI